MRRALFVVAPWFSGAAVACCGVGMAPVRFTGQSDIVIWDAERRTEHFVRQATFDSQGDLGFLAPVPSVPTFAEASPARSRFLKSW